MLVGILSENTTDSDPLKEIIIKILSEFSITPSFIVVDAYGPIVTKIESAYKLFFETSPSCKIAVFLNDFDRYPERCAKVKRMASGYIANNPSAKIVVGCPKPTFEQWLLTEENAMKSVLRLNPSSPIPHRSITDPKARLQKIIDENGDITMSYKDNYVEIAKLLNLNVLIGRDSTFKRFYEDFLEFIR